MTPDERAFRVHLEAGPFRAGVADGRWWLLGIDWPIAFIAVRAAHWERAPDAFVLRFDLTNYPADGPTAAPWDIVTGAQMGEAGRPKGDRVGMAFRTNWENGRALYVACDRVAFAGHEVWANQHRQWIWDDAKDITLFLGLVSELLNDDDYVGV